MGVATTVKERNTGSAQKSNTPAASLQDIDSKPKYNDGESDEFEFGGSFGAAALMVGFPLLMWYMWIGATYYNGQFPTPDAEQSWGDFARHLARLVYEGAYPSAKAWAIYWVFFIFEALM
jgi:delta24(24(1))-sterol reductase